MLEIIIDPIKGWDEEKEEFINIPETRFQIEHSLVSIKKWESKWHKAFLGNKEKTTEEIYDYIRCMTLTPGVDPSIYIYLPKSVFDSIISYINDPMTASWITEHEQGAKKGQPGKVVTNEVIYYWMITLGIPMECERWHLQQLIMLIRVVNAENEPKRKMSQREAFAQQRALNQARRAKHGSKG